MTQTEHPLEVAPDGVTATILDAGVPRRVEHAIRVGAPAGAVFGLIADVTCWPTIFPPTVHVVSAPTGPGTERIEIWATANGELKTWASRRVLDPATRTIEFRQEVSAPPVAAMTGTWIIEDDGTGCLLRLLHEYRAVDDDPDSLAWIDAAVDRNSRSELAALKRNIELASSSELLLSFEDTVTIDGDRDDVYAFLNEAGQWKERLPHVARVELLEPAPGLQSLEMDTRTKDGSTHTTKSFRVCFSPERIVYKQVTLPALMTLHTGYWKLTEEGGSVTATSQHTVVINEAAVPAVLGPEAGVAEARTFVRTALSGTSGATLALAKAYAEGRRSPDAG